MEKRDSSSSAQGGLLIHVPPPALRCHAEESAMAPWVVGRQKASRRERPRPRMSWKSGASRGTKSHQELRGVNEVVAALLARNKVRGVCFCCGCLRSALVKRPKWEISF